MEITFENHSILTVRDTIEKKITKRKATSPALPQDETPFKRQKLNFDSIPTSENSTESICSSGVTDNTSTYASRSSTPASMSSFERNKGGRPKTKNSVVPRLSTKSLKRPTVLRVNRPVQADIPLDIWKEVLGMCDPATLFKARMISQTFKDEASRETVWKNSLRLHFGPSLPDAPPGLSSMHYANLLTQRGCQGCTEENQGTARRTYWAFRRRYCELCLVDKVSVDKHIELDLRGRLCYPYLNQMMQCLPHAKHDSWGHYQWVGDYTDLPSWARFYPNPQKRGYLLPAVYELGTEVDTYLATHPTEAKIDAWFDTKKTANEILTTSLQAVENFVETRRVKKMDTAHTAKQARIKFYKEKALQMTPPIDHRILLRCESYNRAISISRIPVDLDRSWDTLRPKLEKDRKTAEQKIAEEAEEQKRLELIRNMRRYDQDLATAMGGYDALYQIQNRY